MGSKIASLSKLGLKGLQELTIGTGLPGIALTSWITDSLNCI
jgi:hypothetical protein